MINEKSHSNRNLLDQVNQISLDIKTAPGSLIKLSNTH